MKYGYSIQKETSLGILGEKVLILLKMLSNMLKSKP